ncbi:TPA: hypothetical protein RQK07_003984 [Vibrio vulnificus]|uniref:hypothetical protein n=1 Tax=Vibrio vulnificus TaxID=672 RepID=UPI0007EE7FE3|nr:hypothetical protein [Vibrio vulnificus]ANN26085.1 hypothetical protein FORC17_1022 [Vibrio vulnificus]ELK2255094.1 hypothetical protein [Vibrio vulnificus]ELK8329744.1 hypothetical protein [Vibrio vulnificus]ELN6898448.1 hypothetical protein [Vibrio vulnificus]MBN8144262.1 hypothetical protein [Vibrio vulnificus]
MGTIIRVGVDLAKNVFHIHAVDENQNTTWQGKYARNTWLKAIMKQVLLQQSLEWKHVVPLITGQENLSKP